MKVLETDIHISAQPEDIWTVLTDFQSYPEWNPFIKEIRGAIQTGERLHVSIDPPNGKKMAFKPSVKTVLVNETFSWVGRFLFPGVFDGEHIFTIRKTDDGCILTQKENFSGLLVPLFWKSLDTHTRAGFELMNKALKERVENRAKNT